MKNNYLLFILISAFAAISCSKTEEPIPVDPFQDMTKISSSSTGFDGYKMDVYMNEDPFVGFNNVYVSVYDSVSGEYPTDWTISFAPIMTMMMNGTTMKHSCPIEQPMYDLELKAYAGAAVFIMPTTDMGFWTFTINYENAMGGGSLSFTPSVVEKSNPAMVSFISEFDSTTKFFVALIEPSKPDVGINDFEIGIYTKETMMSFPASNDLTVHIVPEMPSMDHGSPENVDPISIGNGRYKGSVNFTMTGLWRVHMTIDDQNLNTVALDKYFDIEF